MNDIMTINGVECYEKDGTAYLKLEAVARGLGFTQKKNGVEYVKWERVKEYLHELNFSPLVGKESFIPENIFYRLSMKAKNETAERFQAFVADEVIPSIRRHGKKDGRSKRDKSTYYYKDLSNMRFGKLTAVSVCGINSFGNKLWLCRCDCGNEKIYPSGKLVSGRATNCGCMTKTIKSKKAAKHGITAGKRPRTLTVWEGMKARCYNPKSISYKSYGSRGIKICDEWLGKNGFENFHNWAIENGYSDDLEIDRIDNDGNYCPENCRWVSMQYNRSHRRITRYITANGITLNVSEWTKCLGISKSTAYRYLNKSDKEFINYIEKRGVLNVPVPQQN